MKTNFFLLTIISNFLNNYFYQLLILFFFMLGDFAVISQIVLFVSPIVFLKDSLSSNQKTLLVSDKKSSLFKIFLKKRIIYASIIAVLYSIIFFNLNNSQENLFIFVVSIIILFLWINELNLAFFEVNLNLKKFIIYLFYLVFLYLFILSYTLYLNTNLLLILIGLVSLIFIQNIYNNNFSLRWFFSNFFKIKKNFSYQLLSTVSINLVNLLWRIIISITLEKEFSGVIFAIFAFASFPASFYNNNIGITLEINKKYKLKFSSIFFAYYVLMISIVYYIYANQVISMKIENFENFYLLTGIFSLLASLIMIFTSLFRIKIINYLKHKRNVLFKIDIFYSLLNLISITAIYFLFDSYSFYLLLFISSLLSIMYFFYYKKIGDEYYF